MVWNIKGPLFIGLIFVLIGKNQRINFIGHPDLRRILLPDGWDGYPLRKEYPYDGKRAWQPGTSVEDAVRSDGNLGLEQG